MSINEITGTIVQSAIKVHKALGPGLLESAYESCLAHELRLRGIGVARQVILPLEYEGMVVEAGFRMDLVVENQVIVEVKSVEKPARVHEAQLLTYLKLSNLPVGLLINFFAPRVKDGIKRFVGRSFAHFVEPTEFDVT
ncbi:GxxExxY protein [bacterium]|nr:GxxExxY protein [bacterium]